jgi:hypothetical protein
MPAATGNFSVNPLVPAASDDPKNGASVISTLATGVVQAFGLPVSPQNNIPAPFNVDPATGLAVVRGAPTDPFGIAIKSYVDTVVVPMVAGGVNNYTATPTPAITAYQPNAIYAVVFTNANTGPSTLAISGLAALGIVKLGGVALAAGDIPAGSLQLLSWPGGLAPFQLLNVDGSAVQRSGSTMTGLLVLSGDPAVALGASTKQYVDAARGKDLGLFPLGADTPITGDSAAHAVFNSGALTIPADGNYRLLTSFGAYATGASDSHQVIYQFTDGTATWGAVLGSPTTATGNNGSRVATGTSRSPMYAANATPTITLQAVCDGNITVKQTMPIGAQSATWMVVEALRSVN